MVFLVYGTVNEEELGACSSLLPKKHLKTHHWWRNPTAFAVADRRVGREDPLGQKELHALAAVTYGPLPVLGSLAAWDVLELVGGEPGPLEPDAGTFGPLTKSENEIKTIAKDLETFSNLHISQSHQNSLELLNYF